MAQSKTMNAVRIHDYGDSSALVYEKAEVPEINDTGILIKVNYTSVNPFDWKVRQGYTRKWINLKMPAILGIDVAGTVEKVGSAVKDFKPGDKVICRADFVSKGGSYAEYVSVEAKQVAHAPTKIPLREAAGIPVAAGTAWDALFDIANLKQGQKILITGASGGVGSMAVQLAKWAGAHVIGTTSTPNLDMVKALGADEVIDYTKGDFSAKVKGVDAVFDTVGGETFEKCYAVVKKGGILVTTAGQPDEEKAKKAGITAKGMNASSDGTRLSQIAKVVDEGKLKINVEKEFKLQDIREAHDLSQSGKARGKIIIKVS